MFRILVTSTCTLFLLLPICDDKKTESFSAKVIGISDGDTITVLRDDKSSIKIRLEGIDAPESSQAFGSKAKDALKELVAGKIVEIRKSGEDRYGRTLGFVCLESLDVNARMVQEGWAWHYKKYNDDEMLAELEVKARAEHRGLWADPSPLSPWEFRTRKRSASNVNPPPEDGTETDETHWLNLSTNVRHNRTCENFGNTKRGRYCRPDEGKPCGKCGG